MRLKRTVVALWVASIALTGVSMAQENATFTLRSGERLNGQLMDLGGVGFTIRVDGQERQVATNDVAVIDFTGGGGVQSDWDKLSNGQFAVLKDGNTITGQLTDVGGSSPLRLTFTSGGNNRDVPSNEVARIVMARPTNTASSGTSGTGGSTGSASGGFTIAGQQQWVPTGIAFRRGEAIQLTANGEIKVAGNDGPTATPAGSSHSHPSNPVPGVPTGALIGRIGNGAPFAIGNQTSIPAPAAGQLFIGQNDSQVSDNTGEYRVEVSRGTGAVRRR